eukprot:TRINITY_DN24356_c0_g1_i1.p3 TRINITY_DN24356_c0_g1~~TRINITY_DN24356_c0_g1_i1.p3  ORF type:complete len:156 (+),score=28.04 TRINITY_DN24356_c0_g1_i1:403-870(+)
MFVQWVKDLSGMDLTAVSQSAEPLILSTVTEFLQVHEIEALDVQKQAVVSALREMRPNNSSNSNNTWESYRGCSTRAGVSAVPDTPMPGVIVKQKPCRAHPSCYCDMMCNHGQMVCALCTAPGGLHAACEAELLPVSSVSGLQAPKRSYIPVHGW